MGGLFVAIATEEVRDRGNVSSLGLKSIQSCVISWFHLRCETRCTYHT